MLFLCPFRAMFCAISNPVKWEWMYRRKQMHLDNYYKRRLWPANKIKTFKKWETLLGHTCLCYVAFMCSCLQESVGVGVYSLIKQHD